MPAPAHPRWPRAPEPCDGRHAALFPFADIVGSTGLGERLGPDEVKALVGECVTGMSRAVEEFGGVIQAYSPSASPASVIGTRCLCRTSLAHEPRGRTDSGTSRRRRAPRVEP